MRPRKDRETYFRGKSVVLTKRDELAYSRVLREFDPEISDIGDICNLDRNPLWKDHTLLRVSPPEEKERLRRLQEMGVSIRGYQVVLDFRRSKWKWLDPAKKWAFDLPLLDWGEVSVGFRMGDEELKRFAGKVLRLVDKVTWKRTGLGLDACRWSQAGCNERRGLGDGRVINPGEKIELNKYYDDSLWDDRLPDEATSDGWIWQQPDEWEE
jgi:DNA-binding Lrp family transcriptional regulator